MNASGNPPGCPEKRLLVQADLDGELDAAQSAALVAHIEHCPDCTRLRRDLQELSARLRIELPTHTSPASLRETLERRLAAPPATLVPFRPRRRNIGWFGAGFAIAAASALFFVLPHEGDLSREVVSSHLRALQPGHLIDIVSTDQHTVKPWFDGRLDFAPPVEDFAAAGYPLAGGRLDYLDGRPVAALIYRHGGHVIDVYIYPGRPITPSSGTKDGYGFMQWSRGGMVFWAVSDVNAKDLTTFVHMWQP